MSRLFPGKDHSVTSADARLDTLRGSTGPLSHTARTIAALTANPGCARRAVLDAAGADKTLIAAHAGFPQAAGASQLPVRSRLRGAAFETQVKANGAADLIRLLRGKLGLTLPEVSYADLEQVGGNTNRDVRYRRTRALLPRAARHPDQAGTCMTTRCCGCRSAATGPTWNRTWSHSRSAAGSTSSRSSRSR